MGHTTASSSNKLKSILRRTLKRNTHFDTTRLCCSNLGFCLSPQLQAVLTSSTAVTVAPRQQPDDGAYTFGRAGAGQGWWTPCWCAWHALLLHACVWRAVPVLLWRSWPWRGWAGAPARHLLHRDKARRLHGILQQLDGSASIVVSMGGLVVEGHNSCHVDVAGKAVRMHGERKLTSRLGRVYATHHGGF